MTVVVRSRRQFLVGTGGVTLALPLLTSLVPKEARAQATQARPRFISLASSHGAVQESNMYPRRQEMRDRFSLYSGHEVSSGPLLSEENGSMRSISTVLSASSSILTPQLISKMNVLRGFDLPWNIGHHTGGHLGNFARNDANKRSDEGRPTIDQVLAYSRSFYSEESLRSNRERSMHIGVGGRFSISWGYANTNESGGNVQPLPTSFSSKELFDSIFVPQAQMTPTRQRKSIVDLVHSSYAALAKGNSAAARRLSKVDRDRLSNHMDRVHELQRRVNAVATCEKVREPDSSVNMDSGGLTQSVVIPGQTREFYETFNDVIVAAFICGTSRIATIHPHAFSEYAGDWHNSVAHNANDPEAQGLLAEENRRLFESAFVDLASKLDVEEADGKTYLDNTLLMWTQESGPSTHDPISLPVVTAGSAAGFFKTGLYADFRRQGGDRWNEFYPGVLYNQWLANVLQSMGLRPEEYEREGERGYGFHHSEDVYGNPGALWPDRLRNDASRRLPLIT